MLYLHGARLAWVQSCVLLSRDQDSAGGQSARGIPFVPSLPYAPIAFLFAAGSNDAVRCARGGLIDFNSICYTGALISNDILFHALSTDDAIRTDRCHACVNACQHHPLYPQDTKAFSSSVRHRNQRSHDA